MLFLSSLTGVIGTQVRMTQYIILPYNPTCLEHNSPNPHHFLNSAYTFSCCLVTNLSLVSVSLSSNAVPNHSNALIGVWSKVWSTTCSLWHFLGIWFQNEHVFLFLSLCFHLNWRTRSINSLKKSSRFVTVS